MTVFVYRASLLLTASQICTADLGPQAMEGLKSVQNRAHVSDYQILIAF